MERNENILRYHSRKQLKKYTGERQEKEERIHQIGEMREHRCHTTEMDDTRLHEDRIYYNRIKKEYDRIIRKEKKTAWEEFTDKLSVDVEGSKKTFYKIMKNKLRSTKSAKSMENENGKMVEDGKILENYREDILKSC